MIDKDYVIATLTLPLMAIAWAFRRLWKTVTREEVVEIAEEKLVPLKEQQLILKENFFRMDKKLDNIMDLLLKNHKK